MNPYPKSSPFCAVWREGFQAETGTENPYVLGSEQRTAWQRGYNDRPPEGLTFDDEWRLMKQRHKEQRRATC